MTQENTPNPLSTFKTQLEAVDFLQSQGYKVGKSTFNAHVKEGLICTSEDGFFHKAPLLGYALHNLSSKLRQDDARSLTAQIERVKSDADINEVRAERERLKLEKEKGMVMPIAQHERDLGARALFFTQEIKGFIHRTADDIIILVQGNENLKSKLVHWWEKNTED